MRCVADNQSLRRGRWTNQTRRQYEATFRMFAAFVGDRPISGIVRSDAMRFVDALSRLDPDWRRQDGADEADLRALLEGPGRASGLSAKTLNRYVGTEGTVPAP